MFKELVKQMDEKEAIKSVIESMGSVPVSLVMEGFIRAIQDEALAGIFLLIPIFCCVYKIHIGEVIRVSQRQYLDIYSPRGAHVKL
jgi:hypothetical protein